jgi:hypothetical protein
VKETSLLLVVAYSLSGRQLLRDFVCPALDVHLNSLQFALRIVNSTWEHQHEMDARNNKTISYYCLTLAGPLRKANKNLKQNESIIK